MRTVSKEVKNKAGELLDTITIQQADNWDECVAIAGSVDVAVELFNRMWVVLEQNRHRPGRGTGTGAKEVSAAVKKLSPEVQALLKGRTPEEIAALLEKAAAALAKKAA